MLLFDTGKKLEKAVGEEAAQIIIETLEKFSEEQKKDLGTKGDVFAVKAELRETELRLQSEIKQAKYDLLKWQIGIGFALGAFMLAGFGTLGAIMAKGFGWLGF